MPNAANCGRGPLSSPFHRLPRFPQNSLACVRNRSDPCDDRAERGTKEKDHEDVYDSRTNKHQGVRPQRRPRRHAPQPLRFLCQPEGSPAAEPARPKSGKKAKATNKTTAAKNAPKAKKAARTEESAGPREGSKTAKVVAMLQRKNGATLEEIMTQMGWQRHTVRGMIAGSLKKAGCTVESFKSEKGDRTYRINA